MYKSKRRLNKFGYLVLTLIGVVLGLVVVSQINKTDDNLIDVVLPDPEPVYIDLEDFTSMDYRTIYSWCQKNQIECQFEYIYDIGVMYNLFVNHNHPTDVMDIEDIIIFKISLGEEGLVDGLFYEDVKEVSNPSALDVLVNKNNRLPSDYIPENLTIPEASFYSVERYLREDCAQAFEELADAALEAGYRIGIGSGYRSYKTQQGLYDNYAANNGREEADTFSARPGHSEHQTGLVVDWYSKDYPKLYLSKELKNTEDYEWMTTNMHNFGFILSYPENNLSGYMFEPWHIRYVGVNLASYLYENNQTLEEYYRNGKKMNKKLY